jgi:hypothetical protein
VLEESKCVMIGYTKLGRVVDIKSPFHSLTEALHAEHRAPTTANRHSHVPVSARCHFRMTGTRLVFDTKCASG